MTAPTLLIRCTRCLNIGEISGYFPNSNRPFCTDCNPKKQVEEAREERDLNGCKTLNVKNKVLEYIERHPRATRPAIVREVMRLTGCCNSSVQHVLKALERKGHRFNKGNMCEKILEKMPAYKELFFADIKQLFPGASDSILQESLRLLQDKGLIEVRRDIGYKNSKIYVKN